MKDDTKSLLLSIVIVILVIIIISQNTTEARLNPPSQYKEGEPPQEDKTGNITIPEYSEYTAHIIIVFIITLIYIITRLKTNINNKSVIDLYPSN